MVPFLKIIIPVHVVTDNHQMWKKYITYLEIYGFFKIIEDASHALGARYKNKVDWKL